MGHTRLRPHPEKWAKARCGSQPSGCAADLTVRHQSLVSRARAARLPSRGGELSRPSGRASGLSGRCKAPDACASADPGFVDKGELGALWVASNRSPEPLLVGISIPAKLIEPKRDTDRDRLHYSAPSDGRPARVTGDGSRIARQSLHRPAENLRRCQVLGAVKRSAHRTQCNCHWGASSGGKSTMGSTRSDQSEGQPGEVDTRAGSWLRLSMW